MPPNDANRGYDADQQQQPPSAVQPSSGDVSANGAPSQGPPPPLPTKRKNGATGPAEGKPKPHVCPICQRDFTTGGHLQRHQRIHTGIKAFKCPYPGCETRTSRQDNLQQHYRTHLSPTLRRGSGTAATRQAVAAAMMAAGLKSSNNRQPRKSKGSQAGTPNSSAGSSVTHSQSPYQTPTQASAPYGGYIHDPSQYGYTSGYPLPPPVVMPTATQSAQTSRVASPINGHLTAWSMQSAAAHHQQFYQQQFSPASAYPGASQYGQAHGYAPGATPSPCGAHSRYYSQGVAPHHNQHHMYSGLQNGVPRDSSYSMMTAGGYTAQAPMSNGSPPRTQSSTPGHDLDSRYRGNIAAPR